LLRTDHKFITPLSNPLEPETVKEIMMYKNYLAPEKEELVPWKDAGASVAEEDNGGRTPFPEGVEGSVKRKRQWTR